MSICIYKFPLKIAGEFTIPIQEKALVLHVENQHNCPMLWAEVDTEAQMTLKKIRCFGTGHPIPEIKGIDYLGTCVMDGGALVWHFYEEPL